MSIHQDSVEVSTDMEPMKHANGEHVETEGGEVQEDNNGSDSLTLFLVAIGSAVLSTLFTLLILAVVNDGTLSFTGGDRLTQFQGYMEQVNGNVGILNGEVESVNAEMDELQAELTEQKTTIDSLDETVIQADETRQQFDGFMSALSVALSSVREPEEAATEENTEPVIVKAKSETGESMDEPSEPEEAAADEVEPTEELTETSTETSIITSTVDSTSATDNSPLPMISMSDQLPTDTIAALILEDLNGNGILDGGETSISGATISLSHHGDVVESKTTDDAGVTFMALAPGSYEITVDDAAGYVLSNAATIQVNVADENEEGQFIYFTIQSEE